MRFFLYVKGEKSRKEYSIYVCCSCGYGNMDWMLVVWIVKMIYYYESFLLYEKLCERNFNGYYDNWFIWNFFKVKFEK